MLDRNLKRLMDLAKRTGDRLIVTDPEGQEPFVLMDLTAYEVLLDLQTLQAHEHADEEDLEDEDDDWFTGFDPDEPPIPPAPQEASDAPAATPASASTPESIWDAMKAADEPGETYENPAQASRTEQEQMRDLYEKTVQPEPVQTPEAPAPQSPGDEQFYLEPIE